ncbi:hypothetical protein BRADI_5g01207v3 [Brachypodium distachyon]|uniref:Uncharacterized protein n=1 Tax=Brachypodium distachyon TaxID=15368 RepID=A0A2K2CET3_BRADI|nr:hypothetical protein BRADI_5g01207v3 [Brachypodium distachyon]
MEQESQKTSLPLHTRYSNTTPAAPHRILKSICSESSVCILPKLEIPFTFILWIGDIAASMGCVADNNLELAGGGGCGRTYNAGL